MRFNIAFKLFLGFLIIILLNFFFVVIVSKLTDLNIIASILKRQNEAKNQLLYISNLHAYQTRSQFIFDKIRKQESADNFKQTGVTIEKAIDSTLVELAEVYRLDSMVNAEKDSTNPGLYEIISLFNTHVKDNNTLYNKTFDEFSKLALGSKTPRQTARMAKTIQLLQSSEQGLRDGIETMDSLIESQTKLRIKDIKNRINGMRRLTLIIVIGISVFSLIFALLFSRAITVSLRRLRESARTIGRGQFDFNPRGYPKDEIGDLATAFFEMAYDLKRTQDELIKSKRLAAIGQIVASVNHEINNPLMIISGNAQFLEMSMENFPQDMKDRVRAILDETERISQVTRKLREIKNPVVEDYTSSGEQMINLDKSSK